MENPEVASAMSRYSSMAPAAKRAWGLGIIVFFAIMCAAIAFSQWWAYHVNVPAYERSNTAQPRAHHLR